MARFALNINLLNASATQFCGYDFNSFCQIDSKHYGANNSGIFELTGDTDNGAQIEAFFELVVSDFGISDIKRIRSIYVGYEAKGDLLVTLKDNEDNERSYTLSYIDSSYDRQTGGKVDVGRDGLGRYWQVRIDNTSGVYFAIDSIELLTIIVGRKPR
jgi:hypothetical protein